MVQPPFPYDLDLCKRRMAHESNETTRTPNIAQEVVFVDQALQDERLVGSGTPGSYGLLDDLFAGEKERHA